MGKRGGGGAAQLVVSPTPATIQRVNNNGQPQAALPPRMKADGHTGKYLGVSRAPVYRYLTEDTAA